MCWVRNVSGNDAGRPRCYDDCLLIVVVLVQREEKSSLLVMTERTGK